MGLNDLPDAHDRAAAASLERGRKRARDFR